MRHVLKAVSVFSLKLRHAGKLWLKWKLRLISILIVTVEFCNAAYLITTMYGCGSITVVPNLGYTDPPPPRRAHKKISGSSQSSKWIWY